MDSLNHARAAARLHQRELRLDALGAVDSDAGRVRVMSEKPRGLELIAADASLELWRCLVRPWVWLLVGAGACTSGTGPEAGSGDAGSSGSTTCPPGKSVLQGACSVPAGVRCYSVAHVDCLCPGQFPFARPLASTCVNGAWEYEPSPSCGCDDDGGDAGGGGSDAGLGSANSG
jgi:hypothetical protein